MSTEAAAESRNDEYEATVRGAEATSQEVLELKAEVTRLQEKLQQQRERIARLEAALKRPFWRRFRDFDELHAQLISLVYGGPNGVTSDGAYGFDKLLDGYAYMMPLKSAMESMMVVQDLYRFAGEEKSRWAELSARKWTRVIESR